MYYYSNYNIYADNLHNLYGTEIIRNTETICGSGIFEGKTLKKKYRLHHIYIILAVRIVFFVPKNLKGILCHTAVRMT